MSPFWNIDFGQVLIILTFLGGITLILRRLDRYAMEHEMVMDWYCNYHKIEKDDLITRQKIGIIFRS